MIKSGLVSVTFRKMTPKEIIELVQKAGLCGIEWGGDVHVPAGDVKTAGEVYKQTIDAGLEIAAYGSYFRIGTYSDGTEEFKKVLETASEIHAPTIRVWAGNKGSGEADDEWWEKVVGESIKIADMAEKANISVSYEYHKNTLTDTNESAQKLLQSAKHNNIFSLWQPLMELNVQKRLDGLKGLENKLGNLHVFHWDETGRRPFEEGTRDWKNYLGAVSQKEDRYALLEFVMGDSIAQYLEDAKVFKSILDE